MKWWQWWTTSDPNTCAWMVRGLLVISLWFWGGLLFFDATSNLGLGTPQEEQWFRLVLIFMYGTGLLVAFVWAIVVFFENQKLKKSTEGQWYDTGTLTKRDLEYDASEADDEGNPETKQ